MAKGLVFIGICFLIHSVVALVTKHFEKYRIKANGIINGTEELAFIPKMSYFECSYFCLKKGDDCKTFFITKTGSCRKVTNPDICYERGLSNDPDAVILYTTTKIFPVGKKLHPITT